MVGRALRGKAAGGTSDAYIVDFHDNWEKLEFWLDPYDLEILRGHGTNQNETAPIENEPEPPEDDTLTDGITPEEISNIYKKLSEGISSNWTVSNSQPFWPVGWYAMPDMSVLVFSDQEQGYNALAENCSRFFQRKYNAVEVRRSFWEGKTAPRSDHLHRILEYIHENKEMPPYYDLGTVDEAAPYAIAEYVRKNFPKFGDNGISAAALDWLREKFEKSSRIQSVYGDYRKFTVAVEMAVRLRREAAMIEEDEREEYHIVLGYYDLRELIEEVYQAFPKLRQAEIINLGWSPRIVKSWFAYCQSVGGNRYKIQVNRLMSSPDIPREAIKYLLYHELLHANGLWHHDKEFRQTEWQYPDSDRWDSELDSLSEKYKLDYSALKKEFNEKGKTGKVFVFTGRRKGENGDSPVRAFVDGVETKPHSNGKSGMETKADELEKRPVGIVEGFKYCRNCGRKLREDANFCDKCGSSVKYE